MDVLLVNAGSSSLKLSVLKENGELRHQALADWSGEITRYRVGGGMSEDVAWRRPDPALRRVLVDWQAQGWHQGELGAVAHRWVHGGPFTRSAVIDAGVRQRLNELLDLAPLHNPVSLEAIDAAMLQLPHVPHIVVFDTAFHASLPEEARVYAIPRQWREEYGIRRYGFHGLSYAYCSRKAHEMLQSDEPRRLVVCHLGQGCSAAAIRGSQCLETTMGFTPMEGLVMATRSGSIDPGIVLHLLRRRGWTAEAIEIALNSECGLLGLSEVSGDWREVKKAADLGIPSACLAIEVYIRRIRQAIGALATSLGGLDALVFTGGVGQNDPRLRADVCRNLQFLGIRLDVSENEADPLDADIAAADAQVRVLVIRTREDLTMLREVQSLLTPLSDRASSPGS